MSFGVVQTMITTLKNNKKMRSKREKFKRSASSRSIKERPEYDFPKATPKQLRDIRHRLRKEHQILWIKVIGLSTVIIIALVWMLLAS